MEALSHNDGIAADQNTSRHALLLRRHQAEWRKTCELELNMGIEDAMETDECSDEMASNANESGKLNLCS